jgi:uncharacterized membrane protein
MNKIQWDLATLIFTAILVVIYTYMRLFANGNISSNIWFNIIFATFYILTIAITIYRWRHAK